jgi:hypothetical protein
MVRTQTANTWSSVLMKATRTRTPQAKTSLHPPSLYFDQRTPPGFTPPEIELRHPQYLSPLRSPTHAPWGQVSTIHMVIRRQRRAEYARQSLPEKSGLCSAQVEGNGRGRRKVEIGVLHAEGRWNARAVEGTVQSRMSMRRKMKARVMIPY